MNKQTEALKQALVDDEGENQAVRMFLALYGSQAGITTKQMRQHLEMAGFDGAWPEWADKEMHLTKAGAQLWIRHLFALAEQPAQQEPADTAKIAAQILTYLGFSQDESIHPGADRRRDTVAMMIENAAPQPAQQEPVASLLVGQDSDGRYVSIAAKVHADTLPLGEHKLYTTPPQRKTLTDEQVAALLEDCIGSLPVAKRLIRAVEAAHGIKENT